MQVYGALLVLTVGLRGLRGCGEAQPPALARRGSPWLPGTGPPGPAAHPGSTSAERLGSGKLLNETSGAGCIGH